MFETIVQSMDWSFRKRAFVDNSSILVLYLIPDSMNDKIVIDTNVIFSGLNSRNGKSFSLLSKIPETLFDIQISVPLILEYESILLKHTEFLGLDTNDVKKFLDYICHIGHETRIYYLWRPILKDPFDDHVLEVAVASNSQFIITHNIKDFEKAEDFNISPMTPGQYLAFRRF